VGGQLKAQLPATLAFFCRDDVNSRILLDNSAASDLPPRPGRAIWQHGADQVQLQVPFLELEEATTMVSAVVDAWRPAEAVDQAIVLASPRRDAA
jgi:DNA segregation ATPase FtsK/SpoIIIE-like protein